MPIVLPVVSAALIVRLLPSYPFHASIPLSLVPVVVPVVVMLSAPVPWFFAFMPFVMVADEVIVS